MSAVNATNLAVPADLGVIRTGLVRRLEAFRARVRRHLMLEGATRLLGEIFAICVISFVLDRWLRLSLPVRMILAVGGAALVCFEIKRLLVEPMRLKLSLIGLAAAIDRAARKSGREGTLAARVATVLELPELLQSDSPPSSAMVERAVLACDSELREVQFETFLDDARRFAAAGGLLSLVALVILTSLASPQTTSLWFRRWFLASSQAWPQNTHLQVAGLQNGRLIVPKGEAFTLRVVNGEKSIAPDAVSLRYREGRGDRSTAAMNRFAPGDFRFEFPSLQEPTEFEASGGDDTVGPFVIEPVERPRISDIQLVSQHPTEAEPTRHGFTGQEADLSFLPKTKLALSFTTSVPVKQVRLKSPSPAVSQNGLVRVDDRHFSLAWTHDAAVQLQIELIGEAELMSLPTTIAVGLKQDQPPRVSLTFSGVRQRVTPQARIPISIQARDDFGVARIDLEVKAELIDLTKTAATSGPTSGPVATMNEPTSRALYGPTTKPTELEVPLQETLQVAALKLVPGSLLSVSASATDGCYLGPQTSRSRVVTFRIVPPEELFKEILLRQQAERVKFRKQIEAAQKIADGLKAVPSGEAAAGLSRDHRLIQREVARTATGLTESVTEMKLNGLGGQEAWDLMDKKILGPLKKLHDETMSRQRDALDSLRPTDAAATAEAAARQAEIITTMQEILKQMSQWDSFVDVVNQLNEIIRLETKVKESAEQQKKKQTEGIFD